MFYSEFFNRNSIKFKPFAIERSFSTCAVIDDYYRCFKYITSITVIYTRILSGSRIGCAVRNKKIQLDGLKLCLLFFCTGYRKSSMVGIGVRDNFATILELPTASSRKRIELDGRTDWTTCGYFRGKGAAQQGVRRQRHISGYW